MAIDRPKHGRVRYPACDDGAASPILESAGMYPSRIVRYAVLLITFAILVTFGGIIRNGFVWDDLPTLVHNEHFRGLDWRNLHWMFTTSFAGHYQPLAWLTLALETYLWGGLSAAGVHFTNLLLHVATSIAFFFVSLRILAASQRKSLSDDLVIAACAGTLLFAIHPLRVESVAWATERRDVLCGAMLMISLLMYLRAVESQHQPPRTTRLLPSLVFYALSLLSKATGITLPLILFVLDVYPLRRFQCEKVGKSRIRRRIIQEKLLYAAIAVPVALAALWAQSDAGALRSASEHPFNLRIAQAFYGIVFYLEKTVWPSRLIPLYEQDPNASPFDTANVVGGACVLAVFIALWWFRSRKPALWFAWLSYLILLSPVLGLAQSGPQVVADRYSYISCMPWALVAAGALAGCQQQLRLRSKAARWLPSLAVLPLLCWLAVLSERQTHVWADERVLWSTVIRRAPNTGTAHANLASALNGLGDYQEARAHANTALTILPGNRVAHLALARASVELGDLPTAESHFTTALLIRPGDTETMLNLARVKMLRGQFADAEKMCRGVIELDPQSPRAYFMLGSLLARRNEQAQAKEMLSKSLELNPSDGLARYRLAVIQLQQGETAAAISDLDAGLKQNPDDGLLMSKLAWILATCRNDSLRDGPRALQLAERAITKGGSGTFLSACEALAAACAEVGSFEKAKKILSDTLANVQYPVSAETRRRLEGQLASYQQARPIRE